MQPGTPLVNTTAGKCKEKQLAAVFVDDIQMKKRLLTPHPCFNVAISWGNYDTISTLTMGGRELRCLKTRSYIKAVAET